MERPLIFSLVGYQYLQDALCEAGVGDSGTIERREFPDGEHYQRVVEDVAERDVVIVGGTIDDTATLMLYDLACAIVKYGARRLTLIVPYFGCSTMERAVKPREVVTAKTRARLLSSIPVALLGNQILMLDLHSAGLPHYFEGPIQAFQISGHPLILPLLREMGGERFVMGSTDTGRAKHIEAYANELGVPAAFVLKQRIDGAQTRVLAISAEVEGQNVVLYDDMIRTGGSLMGAARAYREAGAATLSVVSTHGVLPGDAFFRLRDSQLFDRIAVTDSHPRARALKSEGLEVVSTAPLFTPWIARCRP